MKPAGKDKTAKVRASKRARSSTARRRAREGFALRSRRFAAVSATVELAAVERLFACVLEEVGPSTTTGRAFKDAIEALPRAFDADPQAGQRTAEALLIWAAGVAVNLIEKKTGARKGT